MRERPCYGPIFPFCFPPFLPLPSLLSCYHETPPSSSDLSLNPSSCCCCHRRNPPSLPSVFHARLCVLHCDVTFSDEMAAVAAAADVVVVTCVAAQSTTPQRPRPFPSSSILVSVHAAETIPISSSSHDLCFHSVMSSVKSGVGGAACGRPT